MRGGRAGLKPDPVTRKFTINSVRRLVSGKVGNPTSVFPARRHQNNIRLQTATPKRLPAHDEDAHAPSRWSAAGDCCRSNACTVDGAAVGSLSARSPCHLDARRSLASVTLRASIAAVRGLAGFRKGAFGRPRANGRNQPASTQVAGADRPAAAPNRMDAKAE